MAWTEVSFPFGSTLTYTKMNQLHANFAAICAQDGISNTFKRASMNLATDFGGTRLNTVIKGSGSFSLAAGAQYNIPAGQLWYGTHPGFLEGYVHASSWDYIGSGVVFGGVSRVNNTTGSAYTVRYFYF